MTPRDNQKIESFMAIGQRLGIKTARQYRILAEQCGALADEYVETHERNPMKFITHPPDPVSNTDMVAIGLATYRLACIARDAGLVAPEMLQRMAEGGMH